MPRLKTEPSAAQLAAREAGAARLRAANLLRSKQPTRSTRNDLETNEQVVGQDRPREMPSTGKARIDPPHVEVVDRVVDKDHLENLRFNEDVLTIVVLDSTSPTDDPVPYVINDGRRQAFIRGQEQKVKRKYVEVLARMKYTTFSQEKYKDSQGIDAIRNIPHSALRFPFVVRHDPSPRGKAWLQAILSEA
jgi:hypothetical protein